MILQMQESGNLEEIWIYKVVNILVKYSPDLEGINYVLITIRAEYLEIFLPTVSSLAPVPYTSLYEIHFSETQRYVEDSTRVKKHL